MLNFPKIFVFISINFFTFLFLQTAFLFAQSYDDNQFLKNHLKEIDFTNKLLQYAEGSSKLSVNNLKLLQKKINKRRTIVKTLDDEISLINERIQVKSDSIQRLEKYLESLKEEYVKMIYYAYKNRNSYNKLMFVLSADDFNQSYKRLLYLKQYSSYRKVHVELINNTRNDLENQLDQLKEERYKKERLIKKRQLEENILAQDKQKENTLIDYFNEQEDQVIKLIDEKRKVSEILSNSIIQTINKQYEKVSKLNKEKNSRFEERQGIYSWPLDKKGIILNHFGKQKHPFLKGIQIVNNGIDISTMPEASAISIADGVVSKIVSIPGANKAILITHGDYYTLYANLVDITVNVGDTINRADRIGSIFTDKSDNNITLLQFQIWYKNKKLNPEKWLKRENT